MEHYNNQLDGQEKESSKLSAVASNPKKNIILVVAMVICGALVIYNFIWKSSKTKTEIKPEVSQKNITEETPKIENVNTATAPVLPDPPEITIPDTMPTAPPIPDPAAIPAPIVEVPQNVVPTTNNIPAIIDAPSKNIASLNERRRSSIMKAGGRGGGGGDGSGDDKDGSKNDNGRLSSSSNEYSPTISPNFNPSRTGFAQQKITRIGDTRYIIAQGKVIEATMESALNTDMPGPVRAIISRDVYSEAGNYVLIPKGSRIIGSFLANNSPGAIRVAITWSRVIRPDGVDISVDSPAIDNLGKGGLVAEVDAKIADILASSMASAIIQITTASASQKLSGSGNNPVSNSTTTGATTGTTTTTTGTPTALAIQNATNNLGGNLQSIQQNYTNAKPALQVNQGTKVNIFVNKDIIFSRNYVYNRSKMLE